MDVLLVDTAGRLAIDQAMMEEIQALHAAVKPIETCSSSTRCSVRMR
jgi:signal recognition particle subunit SRP54